MRSHLSPASPRYRPCRDGSLNLTAGSGVPIISSCCSGGHLRMAGNRRHSKGVEEKREQLWCGFAGTQLDRCCVKGRAE